MQSLQFVLDLGDILEQFECLLYVHFQHFGDRLALELNLTGLVVVAGGVLYVKQESLLYFPEIGGVPRRPARRGFRPAVVR